LTQRTRAPSRKLTSGTVVELGVAMDDFEVDGVLSPPRCAAPTISTLVFITKGSRPSSNLTATF
jgi:hypothetical protein